MARGRAQRRAPRGLDVRRRLALVAGMGLVTALFFGVLALFGANATVRAHERVDAVEAVATTELAIDELSESLRADVMQHVGDLDARERPGHSDDLDELRVQAALLPQQSGGGVSADSLGAITSAALDVASVAEDILAKGHADVDASDVDRFDAVSGRLETLIDRQRTELEARIAVEQVRATGERHRVNWSLAAVAAVGLLLVAVVTWWVGRRLIRSLAQLSAVARNVADGDLSARADSREAGEVGDLARTFDEMAEALEGAFHRLAEERSHQDFQSRLDRAFEHLDTEDELSEVLSLAMSAVQPAMPMELLVADSSESHVTRMTVSSSGGAAACPVDSPWACPAVRSGRTLHQRSGADLDACSKLRGRDGGPHAAVCVPVAFMGRSLGVLHAVAPVAAPPSDTVVSHMRALAERTGSRLGTLRAFARAERQASTDGLTGLENRRTFEDRIRQLIASGRGYALLLADLDHFKRLNDTFGHDTGDRALRLFADVLRASLRPGDLVARYGGEEFVIAVPDTDAEAGRQAAERLRAAVTHATSGPDVPDFTVSIGIADSSLGPTLAAQLRIADAALLTAKREGRDRCIVGTTSSANVRDGEPILPPAPRRGDDDGEPVAAADGTGRATD